MALVRYATSARTYLEPRVLVLGITVIAAAMALYRLGNESIWRDTGSTLAAEYERVWLILTHNVSSAERVERTEAAMGSLGGEFTATLDEQFDGVRVILYVRSEGP